MRLLTSFADASTAQLFGDALYAEGIGSSVKLTGDSKHALWIHEEDRMDDARQLLAEFDAGDRRFSKMAKTARDERARIEKEDRQLHQRTKKIRASIEAKTSTTIGTATLGLIVICIVVAFLTDLGDKDETVALLTLSEFHKVGNHWMTTGLKSVQTQPWRIITPMFLHFGFMHIVFNLWWIKDLGTMIEKAFSSLYLLALVIVIAVLSHLAEYYFIGPSKFGGMSGVVYGLFAFLWIRGRFDPSFPYRIPRQLVTFMLIWLAFGFTGFIPIANGVHLGGLVVGVVWGFISSGYLWRRR